MTDKDANEAYAEAETAAGQVPSLLARLAERLGTSAGAKAAFGEPVTEGGRTVIPVAQSMVGVGAGGGDPADGSDSGVGGGGGALTRPLGYIELTSAQAEFVPLTKPWADAKLVLAYAAIVLILARMVVKLVRG
jgi:uncharacterized spore protein YtfJ